MMLLLVVRKEAKEEVWAAAATQEQFSILVEQQAEGKLPQAAE